MEWLKKHADSLVTISVIMGGLMWMNSKLNEIQKDLTVIKTVMVMKGIATPDLFSAKSTDK